MAAARAGKPVAAGAAPAPAPAAATAALPVSVFFAVGKSALDAEGKKAVAAAADFLKSRPEAKVALSGFVDASGSAAKNAELAKERAKAVRAALAELGVAAERVEMRKPEQIVAGSSDKDKARRVEILSAN